MSERRITSVLFGDLVGFTTLSESRDAEEVRELLSQYFEQCRTVIGRYGGTVEKFIGDAVMAVWGVPTAHEDDAERAVRAGLELVTTVAALGEQVNAPALAMRVGVVTGEVAVTVGATAQGMVAGDAVNTASRVQASADPGQVWVDDTTRAVTTSAIAYTDAGTHELKGKAEPLRLWRARTVVASVGGAQRVDGLEAPLAGRERELRLIKELFHATEEARRPRLVVVDGEAGVGKSRLAWEFEKYIDGLSTTAWWHRGRCLSYGEGVAFWALAEALRARFGLVEADSSDHVVEVLDARLASFVPDPDEQAWLRPRLAMLFGVPGAGSFPREDLFAAWTGFFEHLAADGHPVVWVIDDAQYADDGLLDFVEHLLGTARIAVFVLALARPELLDRRPDLGGRRTAVIRLDALDEQAMAQLLDGLVVGLPDAARTALTSRADGVPLFAVETVRALIDRDLVVPRDGVYVPADGVELDLETIGAPASLQALVAARLDALDPHERRVVADASVLGVSFTREGLAALCDDVDLDAALSSLQRKEILRLEQDRFSAERGQYRFVQSVVRQVAYSTQSRRDRKARHLAAANYLSERPEGSAEMAVVVAQHLLDAVDASSADDSDVDALTARARDLLEEAGRRAHLVGSPAEAQRLYEAALSRTASPVEQARLHRVTAQAAREAGNLPTALAHARQATQLFDDHDMPLEAGAAAAEEARALVSVQDNEAARSIAMTRYSALRDVPGAEPSLERLAAAIAVANSSLGDAEESRRWAEEWVRRAEGLGYGDGIAHAHITLGIYFQNSGAPVTARALYSSCAELAQAYDLPGRQAMALGNLAAMDLSRDLEGALRMARLGGELARRSGQTTVSSYATLNLVFAQWMSGALADLALLLAQAKEEFVDDHLLVCLDLIEAWMCEAEGRERADVWTSVVSDNEATLGWVGTVEVERARLRGDLAAAKAMTEPTLGHTLAGMGIDDDFHLLWPPLVLAALAAGDAPLAERLVGPVEGAAPGRISPAVRAQHARLRGLLRALRGDDPDLVEADLRAGIVALEEFGLRTALGRAQEELGRWLTSQGRDDEGQDLLAAAAETYRAIGAHGWLAALTDQAVGASHA